MIENFTFPPMRARLITIIVHVLFLAAFFYAPLFIIPDFPMKIKPDEWRVTIIVNNLFAVFVFYINYSLLIPRFILSGNYYKYIIYTIPIALACLATPNLVNVVLDYLYGHNPDIRPTNFIIGTILMSAMGLVLAFAMRFSEDWKRMREEKKELENTIKATELVYLKKQLNPHFFFNTLNGIYAMIIKKSPMAPKAVLLLSNLMRYVLYDSDNTLVELEKEVNYVTNYVEMQKMRLSENNHVSLTVKGDMSQVNILPLVFIPFIENAFKYGISSEVESSIIIDIHYIDNYVFFSSINDINENNMPSFYSGIGISNSIKRLDMTYPGKYSLSHLARKGKYYVELKIDLLC